LSNPSKRDSGLKYLLTAINTKENIRTENSTGKGNILGQIVHAMKVNSSKELDMGKEAGNLQKITEIFISDLMRMIRKMVMADMFGQTVVCMKEVSQMTLSTTLFI
jgi:hypothetical protein